MAASPSRGRWPKGHDDVAKEAGFKSWAAWILAREKELGRPICGGKWPNKPGPPCGRNPDWGKKLKKQEKRGGRCVDHSRGEARAGANHPNFKHGGYSKFANVAPRYRKRFEDFVTSAAYLSFRSEIALVDARIDALLSQGRHDAASPVELRGQLDRVRDAIASENEKALKSAFAELERSLEATTVDQEAWWEAERLWKLRADLQRAEIARIAATSRPMSEAELGFKLAQLKSLLVDEGFVPEERVPDLIRRLEGLEGPPALTGGKS